MTRRGSNAVEFALVLPLLLVMLSGVVDLGRQLVLADQLSMAVAEGARAGAVADRAEGEDALERAAAVTRAAWAHLHNGVPLSVTARLGVDGDDTRLTVTGTADHGLWFGLLALPPRTSCTSVVRAEHL